MSDEVASEAEGRLILERRHRAFKVEPAAAGNPEREQPRNLVGLSLSGGGIRSAIYNDGFLQGLSHRGFLRYVDYISSVSGGGYIAAHLIAQQADVSTAGDDVPVGTEKFPYDRPCFHDDDPKVEFNRQRWHLGRNPETGQVDEQRLAGVGGYLSHPMILLPAYLWATIFSLAFYVGVCGVLCTLAALFWRTFDDPTFRYLYAMAMGIRIGDELLIAFIPFILLVAVYVLCEILISLLRIFVGSNNRPWQLVHGRLRSFLLVMMLLFLISCIAIFLGNATTNVSANAVGSLKLNQFGAWMVALAVGLQLLVFIGSNQLFRSERQEAQAWQKYLQRFVSLGVVLLLIFALVHWMGRENISGYASSRQPTLLVEDVDDWDILLDVLGPLDEEKAGMPFSMRGQGIPDFKPSANFANHLPQFLQPESLWQRTTAGRRVSWLHDLEKEDGTSAAPVTEVWMAERRVLGAAYAYWLTAISGQESLQTSLVDVQPEREELRRLGSIGYITSKLTNNPKRNTFLQDTFNVVQACWFVFKVLDEYHLKMVAHWNKQIVSPELTKKLSRVLATKADSQPGTLSTVPSRLLPSNQSSSPSETAPEFSDLLDNLDKYWSASKVEWSNERRAATLSALHRLASPKANSSVDDKLDVKANLQHAAWDRLDVKADYAMVNRALLELLYPNAFRTIDVPSTLVIAPMDQFARTSWLGFYLLLSIFGTLTSVFRYRLSAIFRFYRNQLGHNFLRPLYPPRASLVDNRLHRINPTTDGMPFPIWQASSLEPTTVNGSYRVRTRPFIFSPLNCGNEDDPANCVPARLISLLRSSGRHAGVTIGDAVTLSGAAVAPLMTNNRCLSLLVDLLNTGLGAQVYRFDGLDENRHQHSYRAWIVTILTTLFLAALIFQVTDDLRQLGLALVLGVLIGGSLILELGTPHFLRQLFLPREVSPIAKVDDQPEATESTRTESLSQSFYVADGGFCDYLGVSSLLRRKCELIMVSDAGANAGGDHLGTLARMCENAQNELGVRFLDLDHEAPIDFGRLQQDDQRLVHQPYLCIRVRYPDQTEGLLVYCQMAITESDPIEIKQIRNKFPTFPDEASLNQFYTDEQVSAYRALGYHIASKVCRELERWHLNSQPLEAPPDRQPAADGEPKTNAPDTKATTCERRTPHSIYEQFRLALSEGDFLRTKRSVIEVPNFNVIRERLLTAYRLACYEEVTYRNDDIFSEAIWPDSPFAFPNFMQHARQTFQQSTTGRQLHDHELGLAGRWLEAYEKSGDIRSVYRIAVVSDIHMMDVTVESYCALVFQKLNELNTADKQYRSVDVLTAHLVVLAVASQEVHRGRPHAAFQIGGRQKVFVLCQRIAEVSYPDAGTDHKQFRKNVHQVIGEINEMTRCVFQGGEHATVVSFIQCLTTMWGRLARGEQSKKDVEYVRLLARDDLESMSSKIAAESITIVARKDLNKGLRLAQINRLVNAMTCFWYLGYLREDPRETGHELSKFDTKNNDRLLRALSTTGHNSALAMLKWLRLYDELPGLRATYCNAISEDRRVSQPDMPCYLADLMEDLQERLKAAGSRVARSDLFAIHLSAIIASSYATNRDKASEAQKRVDFIRKEVAIRNAIAMIAKKLPLTFKKAPTSGQIETAVNNLVDLLLAHTEQLKNIEWESQCSAIFLKCTIALWARCVRIDFHDEQLLVATALVKKKLKLLFLKHTADSQVQMDLTLPQADDLRVHLEASPLSPETRKTLTIDLLKIWYGSALSSDLLEEKLLYSD